MFGQQNTLLFNCSCFVYDTLFRENQKSLELLLFYFEHVN